ncbi:MAG: hypothetical protein COW24_01685 [Candidatus Kerfeldbacteria bacterium CG15_BIG_FIL_POST_REV_8_21_14_020_45_12]|uniref:Uncharacterized protein n=1 Tax=Candidatus Kerfeldbacteria bacterium CG15_BIG_FIL_POST_REV_8_21_14_020_45_12 TaxID=2014247 RepID=A0A2M7H4J1_9BACT|nr:MAG: hypothetical protein COW24_01685 [Candidatus Kerfeldbacteria bacterium CG15_BIG_FIL_POST_REV_8_21_14_020_45_12]PJA92923.1 MAG: hypothetical protein CO132_05435 [Candidatus Kerfeldbacteria bacterium CG_4_9_14_3_um_filter_45_8]
MTDAVPKYLSDNVFVELGLANLSLDRKLVMLEQMNEVVHKRAMLRVLEQLPEEAKQDLDSFTDLSQADQADRLLAYVPNLAAILLEEVDQVKTQMKAIRVTTE